jgi:hypothetical protein
VRAFTLDELRAVENFFEEMAANGITLDRARREVSARILGHELRDRFSVAELSNAQICEIAVDKFLLHRKETR